MPDKPAWAERIPEAIEQLSTWGDALIDRVGVEKLLGVERRDAQRILLKAGATAVPGRSALIPPKDLVLYLQVVGGAEIAAAEKARRREFAQRLSRIRQEWRAPLFAEVPNTQVKPVHQLGYLGLPDGVRIGPGIVVFQFRDIDQLLKQLSLFGMAMQGDGDGKTGAFPELERLCGISSVRPEPQREETPEERYARLREDLAAAVVLATPEEVERILGEVSVA